MVSETGPANEEVAEDMTISVDDEESCLSDSRLCLSSDDECLETPIANNDLNAVGRSHYENIQMPPHNNITESNEETDTQDTQSLGNS